METGKIGEWRIKEGQKVKESNIIATIETDKTTVDFETVDNFILVKRLYENGSTLKVGDVIGIAAEDESEYQELLKKYSNINIENKNQIKAEENINKENNTNKKHSQSNNEIVHEENKGKIRVSPSAKKIFDHHNISYNKPLEQLTITKSDALNLILELNKNNKSENNDTLNHNHSKQISSNNNIDNKELYQVKNLSQIRKVIAQRLTESKTTIPHE